jgi:hypothetical protein
MLYVHCPSCFVIMNECNMMHSVLPFLYCNCLIICKHVWQDIITSISYYHDNENGSHFSFIEFKGIFVLQQLWFIQWINALRGRVMSQAATCLLFTTHAQFQSLTSLWRNFGGESDTGMSFCLRILVFACLYHSTNAAFFLIYLSVTIFMIKNLQHC